MKKNLILLIVSIIVLLGCKKEHQGSISGPEGAIGGRPPIYTDIWLKNSSGQNLLNSGTPNAINPAMIEVYKLNSSGQRIPYANGAVNGSNGLIVKGNVSDGYYLSFSFHGAIKVNNKATCFLRYPDGREDKITAQFGTYYLEKIWVNDALAAEIDGRNFIEKVEIIK